MLFLLKTLKKNKYKLRFYYLNIILYYHFFNFNILLFLQINNIKINNLLKNFKNLKFLKIHNFNILSLFDNFSKFFFSIMKREFYLIYNNNILLFTLLQNNDLINYINLISVNYFFFNIKYLNQIDVIYNLFNLNYNIYKVFFFKIMYILNFYFLYIKNKF